MKRVKTFVILLCAFAPAGPSWSASGEPAREFAGTAIVDTEQGTRRIPITLIASRFATQEEAVNLAVTLATGGQQALLAALRGRADGRLRLGALEIPLSLVVAVPDGDGGFLYTFVTARPIKIGEQNLNMDSLDYAFGVARFVLGDHGRGEGEIYPAAALSISQDGALEMEQYRIDPGRLVDVKTIR